MSKLDKTFTAVLQQSPAKGGNYRNDAVCSFIGICCALSLHREEQAQPQAKTHEEGSVIAASGGFSSLSMRGCASTKPPDAEGGVMAAREPTKLAKNSGR